MRDARCVTGGVIPIPYRVSRIAHHARQQNDDRVRRSCPRPKDGLAHTAMKPTLDPEVEAKLGAFGRRRRRLIIRRGLCATLTGWLFAMSVVAAVDFLVLLEDPIRYLISAAAYAVVLAVLWWSCLRRLLPGTGPRRLARLVEAVRPELREDLLSAVELGDARSFGGWDSEAFRAFLQENIASRVRPLAVETLLPPRLIVV